MNIKKLKSKLLRFKAKPRYIARGMAIGTFIGMTPFPGFQMIISITLAHLFKGHKGAAALSVFNTNIFTGIFVFAFNYFLGKKILGYHNLPEFPTDSFKEASAFIFHSGSEVFLSLLTGGIMVGILSAIIVYFLTLKFLRKAKDDIPHPSVNKNYTVITGAGAGLGKALALECGKRNMNLILIALPGENLDQFAMSLEEQYRVKVICFETDLTKENTIYELAGEIIDQFQVNMLINNAGIGGSMAFDRATPQYIDNIIMLNIRATAMLTRLLLPALQKQKQGYILNIASLASFSPFAFKTVYPASKAFVYSFSRGLYEELKGSNVFVSVIHPGPMATNPDVTRRIKAQGFLGKFGILSAERTATIAIRQMLKKDSLVIPGFVNKLSWVMMKTIPVWLRLYFSARLVKREFIQDGKQS